MRILFKLEYKSTSTRSLKTAGAYFNVLGEIPEHIALALFLKDSAVPSESKISRLIRLGLIGKNDNACKHHLQGMGSEIFAHMHDQILHFRYFLESEVIVQTFIEITPVPQPLLRPTDAARQKLIPNQRVVRMIQDVKTAAEFKSRNFSIQTVNSRLNHSVARNFLDRVDGSNSAVYFMYAAYPDPDDPPRIQKAHVAIKIPFESGKQSEALLRHEASVLRRLRDNAVQNVPQLWDEGLFDINSGSSVLIMKDLRCGEDHKKMLSCIDTQDLFSIVLSLVTALNGMHSSEITHGLITMSSVHFNFVNKSTSLGDLKYAEIDGDCPVELALMKPSKAVIVDGDSRIQVIDCRVSGADKKRKDCVDLALVCINIISRGTLSVGFCRTDSSFHLTVQDGYDKFTAANLPGLQYHELAYDLCNRFNRFICNPASQISTENAVLVALESLLIGASSLAHILQLLRSAAPSERLAKSDSLPEYLVPAKFIKNEHAMMYPVRLKAVECVDNQGESSPGYGTFAEVDTCDGDLVAQYTVCTVAPSLAEMLREYGKGCHFKTTGPSRSTIFYGARDENGINNVDFMVQHNQVASLIQGAYEVKVNIHPTDQTLNTVHVRRKKANCRFQSKRWPSQRLSYYPGNPEQTEVILVYATDTVKKGEQFSIDYGDQSAREFFGVDSILGIDECWPDEDAGTMSQAGSKRARL